MTCRASCWSGTAAWCLSRTHHRHNESRLSERATVSMYLDCRGLTLPSSRGARHVQRSALKSCDGISRTRSSSSASTTTKREGTKRENELWTSKRALGLDLPSGGDQLLARSSEHYRGRVVVNGVDRPRG